MLYLEFEKQLPTKVPDKLPVYSTKQPNTSQDFLRNMASKIHNESEFENAEVKQDGDWNSVRSENNMVATNFRSGAIRFRIGTKFPISNRQEYKIPVKRLEEIAREFTKRTQILEPDEAKSKIRHITYVRGQGFSTKEGPQPQRTLEAGVILGRQVGGLDVFGLGGFLKVNIKHDESITHGVKVWRPILEKVTMAKILKPIYAIKELERRLIARRRDGIIKVIRADFGYFEAGEYDIQKFLEPTYAFVFESRNGPFPYKSFEVIPATSNPKQLWNKLGKHSLPNKPKTMNKPQQ